jgi:protein-L-isoaspartate(D-aspartate) O-methyltransferase
MKQTYEKQREDMVVEQLKGRDITDKGVIEAFLKVPREEFVRKQDRQWAYDDYPLSIGYGATISQPYIVALMCQILKLDKDSTVLDIGTGSGYSAAILSKIVSKVITIERICELADQAQKRLKRLEYSNIEVICGDGFKGYEKEAPYDGIMVAAATEKITDAWIEQLKVGGRIVYPKYDGIEQILVEGIKTKSGIKEIYHGGVRFVPLIREENDRKKTFE